MRLETRIGVAEGYSCVETKGHKVHHASRFGKLYDTKMNVTFPLSQRERRQTTVTKSP